MTRRHRGLTFFCIATTLAAAALLWPSPAWTQPRTETTLREVCVPAGEYTALVFPVWQDREPFHAKLVLDWQRGKDAEQVFDIILPTGVTTTLNFDGGMQIAEEARLVLSMYNPTNAVRPWGVTREGPVRFDEAPRAKRGLGFQP